MKLVLANTGSYPRIGDTPELQLLRRTIALADRGERTSADLHDAENELTRQAIAEQVRAGVELLTDGLIRWYDPISHLAGRLEGVRIKGLLRFFDTNFYFRQPVLTARPARTAPLLVEEYKFARNALGQMPTGEDQAGRLAIKPVLTGPYTLAKFSLSEDGSMSSLEARAMAYADSLADELRALIEGGARFLQIDEPAIVKYPEDFVVFRRALLRVCQAREQAHPFDPAQGKPGGQAAAGRGVQVALYVYFHDCAALYEQLVQLPVDVLGIDFTYNPKLVELVASAGSPMPLGLGLVDARNTKLEDPAALARQLERLLPRMAGECAYLGPSAGLEYLPRDRASAKLTLLAKTREAVAAAR